MTVPYLYVALAMSTDIRLGQQGNTDRMPAGFVACGTRREMVAEAEAVVHIEERSGAGQAHARRDQCSYVERAQRARTMSARMHRIEKK